MIGGLKFPRSQLVLLWIRNERQHMHKISPWSDGQMPAPIWALCLTSIKINVDTNLFLNSPLQECEKGKNSQPSMQLKVVPGTSMKAQFSIGLAGECKRLVWIFFWTEWTLTTYIWLKGSESKPSSSSCGVDHPAAIPEKSAREEEHSIRGENTSIVFQKKKEKT